LPLVAQVRDQVRTLLRIRRERHALPPGGKPPIGARIVCGDLRMTVQAGMTDALWRWLLSQGWREVMYRPDRRRYREIPGAFVTRLIDATADERDRILAAATANAAYRPLPLRPRRLTRSEDSESV
jgi:hypothetical protein